MLRNVLANWAEIALSVASVFVLYPFLVGTIGEAQYGVWLLISSITGYMGLLYLGVPLATVRHVSKYRAIGDAARMNEAVSSSLVLYAGMAVVVMGVGSLVALRLDDWFKIPPEYVLVAKVAALVAVATTATGFVFEVIEGIMNAFEDFVPLAAVRSGLLAVRVVLTLLVVRAENGIVTVAVLLFAATVVQGGVLFVYVRRRYPSLRFGPRLASRGMMRSIFEYSAYALLLHAATLMSFRTAPLVIGAVVSAGAIVYFSAASSLLLYLTDGIRGIARALMPRSSHLDSTNDTGGLRDVWIDYSRVTYLILLPFCVLFVTLGGDFVAVWLGERFRGPAGRVLAILAISYPFYLVQRGVGYPILMGMSKLKVPTLVMLATAAVNVGLSFALALSHGVEGVAWGTTVPNLANTAFMIVYTARTLKVSVARYLVQTHLVPSLGIPLLALPSLVARRLLPIDDFASFAVAVAVSLAPYAAGAYFLLGRRHREALRRRLPGRRRGRRDSVHAGHTEELAHPQAEEAQPRVGDAPG